MKEPVGQMSRQEVEPGKLKVLLCVVVVLCIVLCVFSKSVLVEKDEIVR